MDPPQGYSERRNRSASWNYGPYYSRTSYPGSYSAPSSPEAPPVPPRPPHNYNWPRPQHYTPYEPQSPEPAYLGTALGVDSRYTSMPSFVMPDDFPDGTYSGVNAGAGPRPSPAFAWDVTSQPPESVQHSDPGHIAADDVSIGYATQASRGGGRPSIHSHTSDASRGLRHWSSDGTDGRLVRYGTIIVLVTLVGGIGVGLAFASHAASHAADHSAQHDR